MRKAWLRVGSVAFLLAAGVLAVLSFTWFDEVPAPEPGSPAFRDYERERVAEARMSVVLGVGASVALLGAFACHAAAGKASAEE